MRTQLNWIENSKTRKSLVQLPEEINDYVKIEDGAIPEDQLGVLRVTDHLVRYYRTPKNDIIELRLVYWDPLRFRRKERATGVNGHIPDVCYPSWGFDRIKSCDSEFEVDVVNGTKFQVRQFQRSGRKQCVFFRYRATDNVLFSRNILWRANVLLNSWREPFLNHESEYVVTIVVNVNTSFTDAHLTATEFTRTIWPELKEFGIYWPTVYFYVEFCHGVFVIVSSFLAKRSCKLRFLWGSVISGFRNEEKMKAQCINS